MPPSTSQFAFRIVGALEEDCDGTGAASGVAAAVKQANDLTDSMISDLKASENLTINRVGQVSNSASQASNKVKGVFNKDKEPEVSGDE